MEVFYTYICVSKMEMCVWNKNVVFRVFSYSFFNDLLVTL